MFKDWIYWRAGLWSPQLVVLMMAIVYLIVFLCALAFAGPPIESPFGGPTPVTPMDTAVSSNATMTPVTILSTATLITAAPVYGNASLCTANGVPWPCCTGVGVGSTCGQHYRYSILIANPGPNMVYYGNSASITTTSGTSFIMPGTYISLDRSYGPIYGICASGLTQLLGLTIEGD